MNFSNNNDIIDNFFNNKKITNKKKTKKMSDLFITKDKTKIHLSRDINDIMMNFKNKDKFNKLLQKYNKKEI